MQIGRVPRRYGCGSVVGIRFVASFASVLLLLVAAFPGQAQTLDRVRDSGTLKLGYRVDARPFSYRDESGEPSGYSMAICRKVADAVKAELGEIPLTVEDIVVGTHERFLAVKTGRIDLLCGATTATLARREEVSFSIPIFLGGIGALLRKDAPAPLLTLLAGEDLPRPFWYDWFGQDLGPRSFSVRIGSTAEAWLNANLEKFDITAEVNPVGVHGEGIEAVLSRRSDVLFGDRAILMDEARRSPQANELMVLGRYFTYEVIALALRRGDEDFRLLVDRALSRLYRSGEIAQIYAGFFGEPDETALTLFSWAALPE